MPPTRKVPLNLRIDPALKTAAEQAARMENRTLTNLIETLLMERCQHHGVSIGGTVAAVPTAEAGGLRGDK